MFILDTVTKVIEGNLCICGDVDLVHCFDIVLRKNLILSVPPLHL